MVKKSTVKAAAVEVPRRLRVLAAVPTCHVDHVQYRDRVVAAVKASIGANPDVDFTLSVCEKADNSVAETQSWNTVVANFQELSDRVVAEGFDYLWLVEADVVVPPHAFSHLLADDADVACGVIPYHFYEQYKGKVAGAEIYYKDLMTTGYVLLDKEGKPDPHGCQPFGIVNLYLREVQDRLITGSREHPIFNGTSCILIKRAVLEKVKWRYDNKVSGFDVYFWHDVQMAGFKAVTDGFVVCEHLGV